MDPVVLHNSDGLTIRNTTDDEVETACPDCGRKYLVREAVQVMVESRPEPVWKGCIDCWLRRTSPDMCKTFEEKS